MRIALITETFLPNVNGVVTTLCRLLEHLRSRGHEALLLAPEGAPPEYAGTEIVPMRGMPLPAYPELRITPPQPGMTARLRRFRPDLVHLAGTMALGVAGRHAARRLGAPLVARTTPIFQLTVPITAWGSSATLPTLTCAGSTTVVC